MESSGSRRRTSTERDGDVGELGVAHGVEVAPVHLGGAVAEVGLERLGHTVTASDGRVATLLGVERLLGRRPGEADREVGGAGDVLWRVEGGRGDGQ